MKRFKKTVAAILMAALLCAGTSIPVLAAEASPEDAIPVSLEEIEPRMKYLSSVSSSILPKTDAISVSSAYTSFSSYDVQLSVSLQYSKDGTNWTTLKTWAETYSPGTGSNVLGRNYQNPPKGYKYRSQTVATVKDSSGKILETAGVFSKTISY